MRLYHDWNQVLKFYGIFFPVVTLGLLLKKKINPRPLNFFYQISSHYSQLTYFPN